MSHKRHRDETSEQVNTHHKRLKDDHGVPHRVDPMRFDKSTPNNNNCEGWVENQTFAFGSDGVSMHNDPFAMPLPDDENDNDNKMKMAVHNTNDKDTEFGLLLYELASLNVGNNTHSNCNDNNNHGNGNANGGGKDNEQQTCPICSGRMSLAEFPDHVHTCLDRMDAGDRNDMRTQLERDSDFAAQYALNHGYVTDYGITCPICNKQCPLGTGINEHINQCIDEQEAKMDDEDDDDEDDDININSNNNNNGNVKKVAPLSREQMISCASKLMTLQQGSQQFDNMLDMFGALGFNKANVKSVLDIEKKQSNNNHNHKTNQQQEQQPQQQQEEEEEEEDDTTLSPIAEEDVDLFGQIKNKNNNNNCNNFANSNEINQGFGQYTFDDDDL